jgi:hypothetical protein
VLDITFGADGNEITRGINEVRGMSRPGVAQCVMGALGAVKILPPGATVYVEVPLTLP